RWAEALREISGRLEEMPAEEGFPAYLATRLAEFYERAGRFEPFAGGDGSVSIIGAVSPPGGDFSEPVTQHTKRFVRSFWALDKELASARFFPAINAMDSYSEYHEFVEEWWSEETGENLKDLKTRAMHYLREDDRLQKIVQLIGEESLPDEQRMTVIAAKLIKEGFLQQNAFDPIDTYAMPRKQLKMLKAILRLCDMGRIAVSKGIPVYRIQELDSFRRLQRIKSEISNDEAEKIDDLYHGLEQEMNRVFPIEDWESEALGESRGEEDRRDWQQAEELMEGHTRDELYDMAQDRDIEGRSSMT
ncbi:MAG: hypothetical protein GWO11_01605, partial [Desulfuromonadales bacterium]|nr:hypothetical protein [Desulfuromonadales bacterium]NIR33191.1 hypothetical protein [Desulfuromonadales bacterium]NIS41977.1 hypothetical protein [Desulfuromonadales bacterium]